MTDLVTLAAWLAEAETAAQTADRLAAPDRALQRRPRSHIRQDLDRGARCLHRLAVIADRSTRRHGALPVAGEADTADLFRCDTDAHDFSATARTSSDFALIGRPPKRL